MFESAPQSNFDYFDWCSGIIGNASSSSNNNINQCNNNSNSNNINLNQFQNDNININNNNNNTAVASININATSPTLSSTISTPPLNNNFTNTNSNNTDSGLTLPLYYQFVPNYGMVLTPVKGANNSSILPPQAWAQPPQQIQQAGLLTLLQQSQQNQNQFSQQQQQQQQHQSQMFQNFLKFQNQLSQISTNGTNSIATPYIDPNVKLSVDFGDPMCNNINSLNNADSDCGLANKKVKKENVHNGGDVNAYVVLNQQQGLSSPSSSSVILSDNSSPEQSHLYTYSPSATLSPPTISYGGNDQQQNQQGLLNTNGMVLVGTPLSLLPTVPINNINNNINNNQMVAYNNNANNNSNNTNNNTNNSVAIFNNNSNSGAMISANNNDSFNCHWETGIEPETLKKQNEISKLLFVKSNTVFFENYSDSGKHQACWNLNEPMHRNYYQTIQFKLPNACGNDSISLPITKTDDNNGVVDSEKLSYFSKFPCQYENYRIYIHPSLGYSGNAKRFKHMPDSNENALVFDGNVYDGNLNPIYNCKICTEYYQTKSYFSANPNAKGKVLLVKNNILTRVKDGSFSLSLKPMCCSGHNSQLPLYFHFTLTNPNTGKVVLQSLINVNVKQWKKSQPKPNSNLKRKRENSIVFDNESQDD